jgi:uncharacterized Zn finger protein (UPF0148 family)
MPSEPLNLDAITAEWLQECGPHDYGVISTGCACPEGDYRPVMLRLVDEVRHLRADIDSLGHWYCPNCGGYEATDVDDDGAMCAQCGHQIEWVEPDTLSRAKAYADTLREAKNRAFEEVERLRATSERFTDPSVTEAFAREIEAAKAVPGDPPCCFPDRPCPRHIAEHLVNAIRSERLVVLTVQAADEIIRHVEAVQ